MTAGEVIAVPTPLTVNGNVTSHASGSASLVFGNLSLGDGPAGTVRTFTVEDGPAAIDLDMAGTITDGAASSVGLDKAGAGTLAFEGALFGQGVNPNTYGGPTRVLDGTLRLDHAPGVAAVPGDLVVGDGVGDRGSARVVLFDDQQVPAARTVTVNDDGVFDLNGHAETVANLVLTAGPTVVLSPGMVETGAGALTVTGAITQNAAAAPAVINGNLVLPAGGTVIHSTDGPAAEDLLINAVISGPGGLTVDGSGRVVIPAANTFSGDTVLRNGVLDLGDTGSLVNSDVTVSTPQQNIFGAVLVGGGTIKSLDVFRGVVTADGVLTVLGITDFAPPAIAQPQALLDFLLFGAAPGQFSQLVTNGLDIGNQTTQLEVRLAPSFGPAPGTVFPVIVNTGNTLTTGRFAGLPNDPDKFNALGPGPGDTRPFLVDYATGDGNDINLIRDTPTMAKDLSLSERVTEGSVATLRGQLVDPDVGDRLALQVDWGDGSPVETFAPGLKPFAIHHRYLDNPLQGTAEGEYQVSVRWFDQFGAGNGRALAVAVENAAPKLQDLIVTSPVPAGAPVVLAGGIADRGVRDTHTLVVDWGDGTTAVYSYAAGVVSFQETHQYAHPGKYTVRLTLDDGDGGTDTAKLPVDVTAPI
jgi:autotransporter-associated beta strand protein